MKYLNFSLCLLLTIFKIDAQDLSQGLQANDLTVYQMENIAKPTYLQTIIDPTFNTTIRRITNADSGTIIAPMYSTIQAWNANESLMIVYEVGRGHQLLNGFDYTFVRYLDDVNPDDVEQLFWDFNNPDILYYLEKTTSLFYKYNVLNKEKEIIVDLQSRITGCNDFSMGNDVQMMSWDSDVFSFRCDNNKAYYYKISTDEFIEFNLGNVSFFAPMPGPSGNTFYHAQKIYDNNGSLLNTLNQEKVEHSSTGQLANGNDGYFAIAFAEGPQGGCIGDIIAHDMTTGDCFPIISQSQGYDYPQSGTHISALAHQNTQSGWLAASMIGYDEDGNSLLDQELVIARAEQGNVNVYRIGHHRSDEDQFDYWGEPHATISPTGTRVLFGSDWSGNDDGNSVDCYVVELPVYQISLSTNDMELNSNDFQLFPNPISNNTVLNFTYKSGENYTFLIFDVNGKNINSINNIQKGKVDLNTADLSKGIYIYQILSSSKTIVKSGKLILK